MKKSDLLPEQPEDAFLFEQSKLYRLSRKLFVAAGGTYVPSVLTSARTLSSASLIENRIEYSPIASELIWAESDPVQRKELEHAEWVRGLITTVYHEQNHRVLWCYFKKNKIYCSSHVREAEQFLNLAESLVIALDMALGDELTGREARRLYQARVLYNSGSSLMRGLKLGSRKYRNALQVCTYATYLRLEGLHIEDIPPVIEKVFMGIEPKIIKLCTERALRIEPRFVELTNPIWQKRHVKKIIKAFGAKAALRLPKKEPLNNTQIYLIAEKWFEVWGL